MTSHTLADAITSEVNLLISQHPEITGVSAEEKMVDGSPVNVIYIQTSGNAPQGKIAELIMGLNIDLRSNFAHYAGEEAAIDGKVHFESAPPEMNFTSNRIPFASLHQHFTDGAPTQANAPIVAPSNRVLGFSLDDLVAAASSIYDPNVPLEIYQSVAGVLGEQGIESTQYSLVAMDNLAGEGFTFVVVIKPEELPENLEGLGDKTVEQRIREILENIQPPVSLFVDPVPHDPFGPMGPVGR